MHRRRARPSSAVRRRALEPSRWAAARPSFGTFGCSLGLAALLLAGCRDAPPDDEGGDGPMSLATTSGGGGGGDGSSSGGVYVPGDEATDQCGLAPVVQAGRHYGTLRGNASELGGACGLGGPDAFFRLEVPRRSDVWLQGQGVGFVPRVGVLPFTCTTDWATRTLACTEGVGTWLLDVAEGSSLVVAVGVDEELPALDEPPPSEGPDPLAFALDVRLRNVLAPGEPCEPPGLGRCGTGTACLPSPPPDDPEAEPGPAVCVVLEGDTCQTAAPLPVVPGVTVVEIDPAAPQTDAHQHGCGGARRAERVLRLQPPPQAGPHAVEIRADRPGVGLAVRGPGCLPEDERGCVAGELAPAALSVDLVGEAFLFVELPPAADEAGDDGTGTTGDEPGEEAPIVIEVELL